jgi:pyridoxamine 5'-phosphate oxidase
MSLKLADIRQDYSKKELSPDECLADPVAQFELWFTEAMESKVMEPTAMHVATVSAQGRPSGRIVLLKGVEDRQFLFYTNYSSRKGLQIADNPYVSLTFFWPELERQVRIEGRLGAWASEQSSEIPSKAELIKRAAMFGIRHPVKVPRPPHWGGYGVVPQHMEFWQGRPSRLHDRVVYTLQDSGEWHKARLAP